MTHTIPKERLAVCTGGVGCFYYGGIANNPDIPDNVGRHLCFCVQGRYDSGANAKYIDELKVCPCGKWPDNSKVFGEIHRRQQERRRNGKVRG